MQPKDPFAALGFTPASPDTPDVSNSSDDPFAALGFAPVAAAPVKPFTYDVPLGSSAQANKRAKIAVENAALQKESDSQNTGAMGGRIANFGKAIVSNIASSEVGLGKDIAAIGSIGNATKLGAAQTDNADIRTNLIKSIRDKESKGQDATKLKQAYNDLAKQAGMNDEEIAASIAALPSTGKVLGEIGGTALDLLSAGSYGKAKTAGMKSFELATKAPVLKGATTVVPELTNIAEQKAKGLFTKTGVANVAKGAGTGYAYDVTQGLAGSRGEDRTGAKAFIPGAGTVLGAAIPLVSETAQSIKNQRNPDLRLQNVVEKRKTELQKIIDSNASLRNLEEKQNGRGYKPAEILAQTDLLSGAVDNTGTIRTENAMKELTDFIQPQEDVISANLKKEGVSLPLADVEAKLKEAIDKSGLKGGAKVRALSNVAQDMEGLALDSTTGTIPLATIHDAKVDKYRNINFLGSPDAKRADKAIAKAFKELVETNTKSVDVQKLNAELGQHYSVLDLLDKLDGKKAEGGRLGKYFAKTVGAIVGSHFGPLGSIVGAEVAGGVKGASMSGTFGAKIGKDLTQSEAMRAAIENGKTPNNFLALPAAGKTSIPSTIELPNPGILQGQENLRQSANSFGSRNAAQSTNIINETIPANMPKNIPKNKGAVAGAAIAIGALGATGAALGSKTSAPVEYVAPDKPSLPTPKPAAVASTTKDKYSTIHKLSTGTEVREIPTDLKKHILSIESKAGLPKGMLESVLMKESSGGADATNSNPTIGKYAYLVGFTNIAKKELERQGKKVDLNTKAGALQAAADYLALNLNKYKNPTELYANAYSSGKLPQKALNQFRDMYNYYASKK